MPDALVALYTRPTAIKYCFNADNHMRACMVLPLNGFGFANLILICGRWLIYINGACAGVVAGVAVVYMGIEYKPMEGPACWSVIIAFLFY